MSNPTDAAPLEASPVPRGAVPPAPGMAIPGTGGQEVTGGPGRGGGGPLVTPRVIGLDLSITATGMAHADGRTETIATRTGDGDLRLPEITRHIAAYLDRDWPDLVVIEEAPPIRAHSLVAIGMVQGVVRQLLLGFCIPYTLVPPASLKKYATGKGAATKPDMRMALYQRAGLDLRDDNQVDAWWLRAMGLDHLGHAPVALPQTHRQALARVAWPNPEGNR